MRGGSVKNASFCFLKIATQALLVAVLAIGVLTIGGAVYQGAGGKAGFGGLSGLGGGVNAASGGNGQNILAVEMWCNTSTGAGLWSWFAAGTGGSIQAPVGGVSAKYPCGSEVGMSGTSGDWVDFNLGNAGAGYLPQYQYEYGSDFYFAFARLNAQTAPQEIFEVGLGDSSVTGQLANFIGLRAVATTSMVDFFAVCRAAAVDGTTVDSTVLEDTATHFVHLHLTSQNSATVTLDSGSALNLTSGCPAAATHLGPVFYLSTSENVGKNLNVLYWEWDNTVTRP